MGLRVAPLLGGSRPLRLSWAGSGSGPTPSPHLSCFLCRRLCCGFGSSGHRGTHTVRGLHVYTVRQVRPWALRVRGHHSAQRPATQPGTCSARLSGWEAVFSLNSLSGQVGTTFPRGSDPVCVAAGGPAPVLCLLGWGAGPTHRHTDTHL